ncbi:MAG: ScyD/ScyE family protein, partial [Micromonosporaceae bacterium]
AHDGLSAGGPGALIRVDQDGSRHIVLSDGLTMPGGLALSRDAAYVSNCGACPPGSGSVLRVPLIR